LRPLQGTKFGIVIDEPVGKFKNQSPILLAKLGRKIIFRINYIETEAGYIAIET